MTVCTRKLWTAINFVMNTQLQTGVYLFTCTQLAQREGSYVKDKIKICPMLRYWKGTQITLCADKGQKKQKTTFAITQINISTYISQFPKDMIAPLQRLPNETRQEVSPLVQIKSTNIVLFLSLHPSWEANKIFFFSEKDLFSSQIGKSKKFSALVKQKLRNNKMRATVPLMKTTFNNRSQLSSMGELR